LLANSSVEHVGIIILGIGLGGTLGYTGALLHMINHALGKGTLFLSAGTIVQEYRTKLIPKMQGIGQFLRLPVRFFLTACCYWRSALLSACFLRDYECSLGSFSFGPRSGWTFLLSIAIVFTGLVIRGEDVIQ
jgi:hydrogenase-4 component F